MASFAIDSTHQCWQCLQWNRGRDPEYFVSTGAPKDQRCQKAIGMLMVNRDEVPRVPYHAHACKYFESNPNPPPTSRSAYLEQQKLLRKSKGEKGEVNGLESEQMEE